MTRMENQRLLMVKDLCIAKTDAAGTIIVQGVHFTLDPGEVLGIAGESGSGKTMTVSAVSGLLPDSVTVARGHIIFCGRPIDPMNRKNPGFTRGRDLLMLLQSPLTALNPSLSVGKQIAEALTVAKGISMREARFHAGSLMEMVGLPTSRFGCHPFQLSGGQRQRAVLAMAFGLKPRVLIADEPTAGQDDENRDQILGLLGRLCRDTGAAAILVSHDLRVLSRAAGKLVVIYRGRQVETGPSADIIGNPVHPHTRELVAAMRYLEKASSHST